MSYAQLMMDHVQLVHKHVMLRADVHHLAADLRDLLSFIDEETKDTGYQEATQKAPGDGTMSQPSPLEHGPLPGLRSQCNAKGLAEVAAAIRCPSCSEAPLQGTECTSKVRVPVCVLFGLVHGQGS